MFQVINSTDPVKTETLVALIYGEPGIGKTSLASTSSQPVLLDFDGGVQRACYRQTAIRVNSWAEVGEFQRSPEYKSLAPKTLIIDTAGGMLDNYVAEYVKEADPKNKRRGGELSLQGYGAMKDVFAQFKNWCKTQKINLIFIAHTTSEQEGDNTKFIPKVTGGSYDILRQECDLVGYISSNKNQRVIDFNPTDSHIGKNCAEIPLTVIPDYKLPEYKTFFQDLISQTLGKMNALGENQLLAVKKVKKFTELLTEAQDADGLNKLIAKLQKETDRPVQLQMFNVLKGRAKELNIPYDGEAKIFIPAV